MIKNSILIGIFLATLAGSALGQDLQQKVTLQGTDKSLEEILEKLSKDYEVSFSYMNNELPGNRFDVDYTNVSMDKLLANLLDSYGYDYTTKSGKIIIYKSALSEKKPIPTQTDSITPDEEDSNLTDLAPEQPEEIIPENKEEAMEASQESFTATNNPNQHITLGEEPLIAPENTVLEEEEEASPTLSNIKIEEEIEEQPIQRFNSGAGVVISYKSGTSEEQVIEYEDPNPLKRIFTPKPDSLMEEQELKKRIGHAGIFYPISTNGSDAKDYENNISFHLFTGHSGGLKGFEFAGIASVVKGNAYGVQFSGVTNLVNGDFKGAQVTGVTNINWYDFEGLQAAGIANISYDRNIGAQLAGIANIARGRESGLQIAGVTNISYGRSKFGQASGIFNSAWSVDGIQVSFIANLSSKQEGLQVAGLYNEAGKISGAQVSGFINKGGEVKGAQVATFLNVAKRVHGVQIALINISEEMYGTPIGLFCLAKRNGYYDFELYYSDDFQANATIKVGAPHFHNIFAFSYETDNKNRWAYGYGFGSQWGRGNVRLNTDLISYYVSEKKFPDGGFRDMELNILNRFRFLPSLHVGDFGVFAGPTFNLMISDYQDSESGEIGSDITPEPLYEKTYTDLGRNVKFWIGYNVGVRF